MIIILRRINISQDRMMKMTIDKEQPILKTPLKKSDLKDLKAGDLIYLSGDILGARDMAHKRLIGELQKGNKLPVDIKDNIIFYVGPSPTPPGKTSGSIGPTTSSRMDAFTGPLLQEGLLATIGKGERTEELKNSLVKHGAVYFITPGGVAAYLADRVENIKKIAYKELGPEAIFSIRVRDLPLFVAYDARGGDIFR